jgi:hypothetical protein
MGQTYTTNASAHIDGFVGALVCPGPRAGAQQTLWKPDKRDCWSPSASSTTQWLSAQDDSLWVVRIMFSFVSDCEENNFEHIDALSNLTPESLWKLGAAGFRFSWESLEWFLLLRNFVINPEKCLGIGIVIKIKAHFPIHSYTLETWKLALIFFHKTKTFTCFLLSTICVISNVLI